MTRLDRVLNLLERYDSFLVASLGVALSNYDDGTFGWEFLAELRKEKDQLTQELIEHGCRRKD